MRKDKGVQYIVKTSGEALRVLESYVSSFPLAMVETTRPIFQFDVESAVYTHIYDVFTHPKALPAIAEHDIYALQGYPYVVIRFNYDGRMTPESGEIKVKEAALARLESSLMGCGRGHAQIERFYPPLAPDYVVRCPVCGSEMKTIQVAPLPDLRAMVEGLPEYQPALTVVKFTPMLDQPESSREAPVGIPSAPAP